MPTEKPRVTFALSEEQLQKIDTFRFENRMKNQTQAILTLIERGLSEMKEADLQSPHYSDRAAVVAEAFDKADERSKKIVELELGLV